MVISFDSFIDVAYWKETHMFMYDSLYLGSLNNCSATSQKRIFPNTVIQMNTSSLIIAHIIVLQLKCELHVLQYMEIPAFTIFSSLFLIVVEQDLTTLQKPALFAD